MAINMGENKNLSFLSDKVNEILNDSDNESFKDLLIESSFQMKNRKYLDIKKVKEESGKIAIGISLNLEEDTDIELFNEIIDKIQALRDRLAKLFAIAQSDFHFLDKTYIHLFKIWVGNFSKQKSNDKREGEAELILHFMFKELIDREDLFNYLKNILQNMNFKMEALSRKITVLQQVHKVIGSMNSSGLEYKSNVIKHRQKMNKAKEDIKTKGISLINFSGK